MNELNITWQALLPAFFFHRALVFLIGAGMFAHFMCMATAAPEKSPRAVMIFIMLIVGSSAGMMAAAFHGEMRTLLDSILIAIGSMFSFWLWLWFRGMHVKDFLEDKYGNEHYASTD